MPVSYTSCLCPFFRLKNYYYIIVYLANNFTEPHLPGRKRLRSKDEDDGYSPGMFRKILFYYENFDS